MGYGRETGVKYDKMNYTCMKLSIDKNFFERRNSVQKKHHEGKENMYCG